MSFLAKLGIVFAVLIIGLFAFLIFGPFYSVDQGEEAVVLRNGAIVGTSGPGLHIKMPFIESVQTISLQKRSVIFGNDQNYPMEAFSSDQQPLDVIASVNFHVPPGQGAQVYSQYGSVEGMTSKLVDRVLPAVLKDVFGQYDIQSAVQKRPKLNADILTALQKNVEGDPVIIDSLQIEDMSPTKEYRAAIEAKQQATVEVQKREQELAQQEVAAKITVTNAQAAADAKVAGAKADAQATELDGQARANAIKAMADALQQNPSVIELTKAQRWDGRLPTTMIPGGTVPFLDVKPQPAPAG